MRKNLLRPEKINFYCTIRDFILRKDFDHFIDIVLRIQKEKLNGDDARA